MCFLYLSLEHQVLTSAFGPMTSECEGRQWGDTPSHENVQLSKDKIQYPLLDSTSDLTSTAVKAVQIDGPRGSLPQPGSLHLIIEREIRMLTFSPEKGSTPVTLEI